MAEKKTAGAFDIRSIIGLLLGTDALIGNIETPLSGSWFVRPYPIRGDHILMLAATPVVLAGLGWFLLRTDAGRAVRAAAENEDRALLLGVPVRQHSGGARREIGTGDVHGARHAPLLPRR